MDWLRLDSGTPEHAKVLALADALDVSVDVALAVVVRLWCWTARVRPDGDLTGCTPRQVCYGARIDVPDVTPGQVLEALVLVGLVDRDDAGGLVVHEWNEHQPLIRRRAADRTYEEQRRAVRQEKRRAKHKSGNGTRSYRDRAEDGTVSTRCTQTDRQTDVQNPTGSCAETNAHAFAAAPDPDCPAFPCDGPVSTWRATLEQRERWAAAYPSLSIPAEYAKAHAWIADHPARRKTAGGMARFLGGWFGRAQNRGPRPVAAPEPDLDRYLEARP